ncbi:MAG: anti-sigma factor family protein, partial [Bacteroidota bacterium]
MKKIPQLLEDKLLDYLDGKLTPVERADFEQQLRTNTALQSRLEDIRAMENSMHLLTPEQPSKNFTQVVMGKLEHFPSKASHSMRNGILLLAGILTAAGIGAILLSAGVFDSSQSAIDLNEIGLQSKYLKKSLPAI